MIKASKKVAAKKVMAKKTVAKKAAHKVDPKRSAAAKAAWVTIRKNKRRMAKAK